MISELNRSGKSLLDRINKVQNQKRFAGKTEDQINAMITADEILNRAEASRAERHARSPRKSLLSRMLGMKF